MAVGTSGSQPPQMLRSETQSNLTGRMHYQQLHSEYVTIGMSTLKPESMSKIHPGYHLQMDQDVSNNGLMFVARAGNSATPLGIRIGSTYLQDWEKNLQLGGRQPES